MFHLGITLNDNVTLDVYSFSCAENIVNNLSVKSKFTLISHLISSAYGIKLDRVFF